MFTIESLLFITCFFLFNQHFASSFFVATDSEFCIYKLISQIFFVHLKFLLHLRLDSIEIFSMNLELLLPNHFFFLTSISKTHFICQKYLCKTLFTIYFLHFHVFLPTLLLIYIQNWICSANCLQNVAI